MNISRTKFIILFLISGFAFLFLYNSILGPEVRVFPGNWEHFLMTDSPIGWKSAASTLLLPIKIILVGPLMPYLNFLNDDPPPPFIAIGFIFYWSILASLIYYLFGKLKE